MNLLVGSHTTPTAAGPRPFRDLPDPEPLGLRLQGFWRASNLWRRPPGPVGHGVAHGTGLARTPPEPQRTKLPSRQPGPC